MAKATSKLGSMSVDALLKLRDDIGLMLRHKGRQLQSQLHRLGASGGSRDDRERGSRKGVKVAPKYRGPNGETWAGRGATPKWLAGLMKQGHKRDEFLIARPASGAVSKKPGVKRSPSKRPSAKKSAAKRQ